MHLLLPLFYSLTFVWFYVILAEAGYCWLKVNKNGRCTTFFGGNVSRQDCCSDSRANTAWTPQDLSSGQLFYWTVFGGGVPCQPCKDSCVHVKCSSGKVCSLRKGKPICVCRPKCPKRKRKLGAVCGNDGNTYKHVCKLLKVGCRKNTKLEVAYFGSCQDNSCQNIICSGKKTCLLDQNFEPHCVHCRNNCSAKRRYICGSNNVTYSSRCTLRKAACFKGMAIKESYRGHCKVNASCETIRCNKGRSCLMNLKTGIPLCTRCPPTCPLVRTNFQCASRNQTNFSWCQMMKESCRTGIVVGTKSSLLCSGAPQASHHLVRT